MATGKVRFFKRERHFGFIRPDDGGRDIFVHISAVERAGWKDLDPNQWLEFDIESDRTGKGPKAVNLKAYTLGVR